MCLSYRAQDTSLKAKFISCLLRTVKEGETLRCLITRMWVSVMWSSASEDKEVQTIHTLSLPLSLSHNYMHTHILVSILIIFCTVCVIALLIQATPGFVSCSFRGSGFNSAAGL